MVVSGHAAVLVDRCDCQWSCSSFGGQVWLSVVMLQFWWTGVVVSGHAAVLVDRCDCQWSCCSFGGQVWLSVVILQFWWTGVVVSGHAVVCFAVCAENYKFLQRVQDQPLLDMDEISMQIYSTVPAMNTVMVISSLGEEGGRQRERVGERQTNRQNMNE